MTVVVFVLGLAVLIALAAIVFAIERKVCPVCQRRRVRMKFTDGFSQGDTHIVSYRCGACHAEFRTHNGGPLIPRPAFDEGVRELVPAARVVEKR